mmetsp:Transcript_27730/g.38366  ORF Transcript_27730/g.38366 Transcript_27730/m.38366 type:complete len:98 (+) Transcript_27730:3-296(+)
MHAECSKKLILLVCQSSSYKRSRQLLKIIYPYDDRSSDNTKMHESICCAIGSGQAEQEALSPNILVVTHTTHAAEFSRRGKEGKSTNACSPPLTSFP